MSEYAGEFEPGRLRRAAVLAVKKLGPRQFRIRGQEEEFYDVNLDLDTPCTCADAWHHGRGCKHELSARLHSGDMKLIQSLGEMLLAAERRTETKRAKRSTEEAA